MEQPDEEACAGDLRGRVGLGVDIYAGWVSRPQDFRDQEQQRQQRWHCYVEGEDRYRGAERHRHQDRRVQDVTPPPDKP